jgi:acetyl-CoA acetyltransferase
MEAKKQAVYAGAQRAELAKLGDRATMRVTALDTFFTGLLGAEAAKHIRGGMYSAGIVESLEKMASKFQSQNAASFSQAHREPNTSGPGRVSEAEYDAMTPGEKYSYSKGFDQKQFR